MLWAASHTTLRALVSMLNANNGMASAEVLYARSRHHSAAEALNEDRGAISPPGAPIHRWEGRRVQPEHCLRERDRVSGESQEGHAI